MRRLLIAVTLGVFAFLGAAPAVSLAEGTDNEIGACLAADQVWLLVVAEGDKVLANQCTGNPTNGEQALADGGLQIQFGKDRLICTLSGNPATCPTTFDGSYWSYYQGAPGKDYTYSEVGPAQAKPKGGTIEAWCYVTKDEKACTLPQLKIVQAGAELAPPAGATAQDLPVTANPKVSIPGGTPWALIGTGIAAVIVIGALVAWQVTRRKKSGGGAVGGR